MSQDNAAGPAPTLTWGDALYDTLSHDLAIDDSYDTWVDLKWSTVRSVGRFLGIDPDMPMPDNPPSHASPGGAA